MMKTCPSYLKIHLLKLHHQGHKMIFQDSASFGPGGGNNEWKKEFYSERPIG